MTSSFSVIFKGQMVADVYMFDVIVVEDNLTKSFVIGNVVLNAKDRNNMKTYIQGHGCMKTMSETIVQQCISTLNNILKVIE